MNSTRLVPRLAAISSTRFKSSTVKRTWIRWVFVSPVCHSHVLGSIHKSSFFISCTSENLSYSKSSNNSPQLSGISGRLKSCLESPHTGFLLSPVCLLGLASNRDSMCLYFIPRAFLCHSRLLHPPPPTSYLFSLLLSLIHPFANRLVFWSSFA